MEQEFKDAAMDVDVKKRRLPKGTSEYQAAWIVDDEFSDEETDDADVPSIQPGAGSVQPDSLEGKKEWDEDMEDAEVFIYIQPEYKKAMPLPVHLQFPSGL